MEVYISLLGIVTLLAIAYAFSTHREHVNLRVVFCALMMQILFGAFVFFVPVGQQVLNSAAQVVTKTIEYGQQGITFLFGDLGNFKFGFIFAINVLAMVIFVSALTAVLYYLKIMQRFVKYVGGAVAKVIGTSKTESLSATANIFLGPVESPMMVRPFIATMTKSEIFAVMTGGLASVAGSTMMGYIQLGIDVKYLLTAAFMTAPAGLLFAKIICPELPERVQPQLSDQNMEEDQASSLFDAASTGAYQGLQQALAVGASLLAFVGLIALLNGIIGFAGGFIGLPNLSLELMLSYIFAPLTWLMGVPASEVLQAASFIGQKLAVNEFVAYVDFIKVADQMSPKTQTIVSFALCGFANFTSLAFVIGGLSAMAPKRRHEIGSLGMRSLLAAFLANLMSGTIAGLLMCFGTFA